MKRSPKIILILLLLLSTSSPYLRAQQPFPDQALSYSTRIGPWNGPVLGKADTAVIMRLVDTAIALRLTAPDSAFALLVTALKASEDSRYRKGMVRALIAMGTPYQDDGNYTKALEVYQRGIALCGNEEGLRSYLATLYNNTGNVYRYLGNYQYAAAYYNLALQKVKDSPGSVYRVIKARTFNNLSAVLMDMGENDKADYYISEGEALLRQYRNDRSLGRLLNNKAALLIKRERLQESLAPLNEALSLSRITNDKETQNLVLNNLSVVHLKRKETGLAIASLEQAIRVSAGINPFLQVSPYLSLGELYMELKDYKRAADNLGQALQISNKAGLPGQAAHAHQFLSRLYGATKAYDKAWYHERLYNQLHDSLLKAENSKNINMIEARYRSAEKDKEIKQARQVLQLRQQAHVQQKKVWIMIGSLGLILLLGIFTLLYLNIRNKQRFLSGKMHIMEQDQEITLLRAHMDGEEKERVRIGREIHDGIGGLLSAAKIRLSTMRLNNHSLSNEKDFNSALLLIDDANLELRKTAHNLLPEVILKGGLPDAIRNFADHIGQGVSTVIHLQCYGEVPRLEQAIELSVFRVVQELVNNIIKHAAAAEALIQLNWQDDFFSISVEDDGIGFTPDSVKASQTGIGLQNIEARVKALDGNIEFESAPGAGTAVYIEFDSRKLIHAISLKNASYYRRHSR